MRGRLIQRFNAEILRLNTKATDTGGYYDEDFREIVAASGSASGIGAIQRQEHTAVILPCQMGNLAWEVLRSTDQGNAPRSDMILYFHFRDLEAASLVHATTGDALIRVGDRLASIRDIKNSATIVQSIRTPPGLYVKEARPSGWGISMSRPKRNLLRVSFTERSAAR